MPCAGEQLTVPLVDGATLEAELFLPGSRSPTGQAGPQGGAGSGSGAGFQGGAGPGSGAGFQGEAGPHPGVLVLHESFGLNDDMRRIARRFAREGYAVLLPNLFSHGSRIVCLSRVMTDMVRGAIDREIADILAARAALAEREDVDADRIAVAGFCLGGGFALIAATKPGFKAAAVNYGDVPKNPAKLDGVCPVVGSFGSKDRMFGRNMAERLEAHLSALGVDHDIETYDGVGHSFFSQHEGWQGWLARMPTPMMVGPDADAAEDGWRRMLGFFAEHVCARVG